MEKNIARRQAITEKEKLDEIHELLPEFYHTAYYALAQTLGMKIPKGIPKPKPLDDEWVRLKELLADICGVEETPAKEIFKYRNAPCFIHPHTYTPEEQEYEHLYLENKLVIDGVPIRWGESPCFTWCTQSNTPACQKILRQLSIFPASDYEPEVKEQKGQLNLFD